MVFLGPRKLHVTCSCDFCQSQIAGNAGQLKWKHIEYFIMNIFKLWNIFNKDWMHVTSFAQWQASRKAWFQEAQLRHVPAAMRLPEFFMTIPDSACESTRCAAVRFRRIPEVFQKQLSALLCREYEASRFLTEAVSNCTEQIALSKSDTEKSGEFSK